MNLSRFQLRARPFRTTPDTGSYYPATPHEAALQYLLRAIDDEEGFALLTGAPGVGKTLLAHLLLTRLPKGTATSFITNCRFVCRADLLRAILFDLAQPYQGTGEQELRLALTDHLLGQLSSGKRTVLVFDEAQGLSPDLLEELRLLGNLETAQGKAVQIVLIGQPGLRDTLAHPELAGLSQRLPVRVELEPLNVHEAADYLLHQIRSSGGRPERVISDEAVHLIAQHTNGIPRVLNQVGYQALTLAEQADAESIDAEVALEALAGLGIEADLGDYELPQPRLATVEETGGPHAPFVGVDYPAYRTEPGQQPNAELANQAHAGDPSWGGSSEIESARPPQTVYFGPR